MEFLYGLVILGAIVGGGLLALAVFGESSAPQQGALAAVAVACAVIPYCFARACQFLGDRHLIELRKINEALTTHTRLQAEMANVASENKHPKGAVSGAGDKAGN